MNTRTEQTQKRSDGPSEDSIFNRRLNRRHGIQVAQDEATKPWPGRPDPLSSGAGADGEGGGCRQAQMGQQSPVFAHLCGLLRGAGERLEVPLSLSEPRWR